MTILVEIVRVPVRGLEYQWFPDGGDNRRAGERNHPDNCHHREKGQALGGARRVDANAPQRRTRPPTGDEDGDGGHHGDAQPIDLERDANIGTDRENRNLGAGGSLNPQFHRMLRICAQIQ